MRLVGHALVAVDKRSSVPAFCASGEKFRHGRMTYCGRSVCSRSGLSVGQNALGQHGNHTLSSLFGRTVRDDALAPRRAKSSSSAFTRGAALARQACPYAVRRRHGLFACANEETVTSSFEDGGDIEDRPKTPAVPDDTKLVRVFDADGSAKKRGPSKSSIDKQLASLAVPALGALALDPILSLIDTAFIGQLGDAAAIGGVGIASIVLSISFSIFNFLAMATTPLVACALNESNGKNHLTGGASRVIATGFFLALVLGSLSGSIIFSFAPVICRGLGASAAVLPHSVSYLRARAAVAPIVLMSFVGNGAFRGYKDTRTPFLIALAANFVNLVLDPIFIFTLGLGVQGAAMATSVSQVVAIALMITSKVRSGRLRVSDMVRIPVLREVLPLLRAGVALTVRTLSILSTVAYATAIASTLGTTSLAAFEITRQMFVLHAMFLDSIAAAAQALVSSFLAKGQMVRARVVANRALILGAVFGTLIGVIAVSLGPTLPRLFTRSVETCASAVLCIRVAAACTPLNGAVFALDGVLAAARDYSYMAFAIACAGCIAVTALTAVRWYGGGVAAVWGGLNVLMIARAAVLFVRYSGRRSPIPPRRFFSHRRGTVHI